MPADDDELDRLLQATLGGEGSSDATGESATTAVEAARVLARLRRLPPEQARAVVLAVFGGCTADEISRRDGVPLGTAKTRIRTGLRRLRQDSQARPPAELQDPRHGRRSTVADGRHKELEHEHEDGEHVDVVALVLGDVDGQRRAEMAAHVLGCPTCRREYDEVAANVGELLPAVPAVQPPLGFDEHVLRRFAATRTTRVPLRPRWAWLAAAAATLAIVVAAALGWWATRADDGAVGDVAALSSPTAARPSARSRSPTSRASG